MIRLCRGFASGALRSTGPHDYSDPYEIGYMTTRRRISEQLANRLRLEWPQIDEREYCTKQRWSALPLDFKLYPDHALFARI